MTSIPISALETTHAGKPEQSRARLRLTASVAICATLTSSIVAAPPAPPKPRVPGIKVGKVATEVTAEFKMADGLPSDNIFSIAALPNGQVYAVTAAGLARFTDGKWGRIPAVTGQVTQIAPYQNGLIATSGNQVGVIKGDTVEVLADLPKSDGKTDEVHALVAGDTILIGTRHGLFRREGHKFVPVGALNSLLGSSKDVRQIAIAPDGHVAVAAMGGLYLGTLTGDWKRLNPVDDEQSWLPRDVRGVAFDSRGRLWFASPQGVGCSDGGKWNLWTGDDGLPYNDFTTMAAGEDGAVWFGTRIGAIRFDGSVWNYREGRRWLPDDRVRSISVRPNGEAWFATRRGVGRIERHWMTLAEKAEIFETAIDKYHRRTPYQYVLDVNVSEPGKIVKPTQHDSDNDGLWTAMYGAGECFAYASSGDAKSKERAKAAFGALRFLSQVTQGGEHPAPKGFPARSILPTSGPDPNKWDSVEHDRKQQRREPLWKVLSPRWPKSADGKWYWKTDTSSDELDGHYFLYALYYDLVAETEAERAPVRQVVADVTSHILDHDYNLVDHDGKPTRWARFGPNTLNQVEWASGRGLNTLSILSYLLVADHVTGDPKYRRAFENLVKQHGYLANLAFPKSNLGPGTGNQSDDEMGFMSYYNLLHYAKDREVRRAANSSLSGYWLLEERESNPVFNYIFAASSSGGGRRGAAIPETCLSDALDTLKRYPLNRFNWGYKNSHRIDIEPLYRGGRGFDRTPLSGFVRATGHTVPVDERFVEQWNHDPWILDQDGNGKSMADAASYLLPYYMGRYFGFLIEEPSSSKPSVINSSAKR